MEPDNNALLHTGVKRQSGRYEWGTGEVPYQHEPWFEGFGKDGVSASPYAQELWYNNFDNNPILKQF